MKTNFPDITRASRLAVVHALRTLERKDFPGEAARAFNMQDLYIDDVRLLLVRNAERIRPARALTVVRQAATWTRHAILTTELATRKARGDA